jgi:hypothetical protein
MKKSRSKTSQPRPTRPAASTLTAKRATWLFWITFLTVNILLSIYFLDSVPSPNPTSRILPVLTLYEEGTYAIDKYEKSTMDKSFVNGHYYSDKAPLSTWIVLPFYGLLRALHLTGTNTFQWLPVALLGDILCGSLPFVVLLCLVLLRLVRQDPASNPVLLCMLPLYGSFVFAYSGVFMSHVLAGALLCGSYILLRQHRQAAACGLLLGLAVLAEFPTALAVPVWMVAIARGHRKDLIWFVVGGLPCALALLFYNHAITGSATSMPYAYIADSAFADMRTAYGIRFPQLEAVWGLLFSTYRGMFFYAPALIVIAITYLVARRSKVFSEDLLSPLGLLAACYLLLISSYFVWWGGWSYGPRHLLPLAMLLFYEGIPLVARRPGLRGWLYALSVCGIGMVWVSKATALYLMPEQFSNPVFDIAIPSFERGQLRHDALPSHLFDLDPVPAAWLWLALFALSAAGLHIFYVRTFLVGAVREPPFRGVRAGR